LSSATEKPGGWYALDVDIDGAAHEAVEYALMEAGALGTETTDQGVTAYFAETPSRSTTWARRSLLLAKAWPGSGRSDFAAPRSAGLAAARAARLHL